MARVNQEIQLENAQRRQNIENIGEQFLAFLRDYKSRGLTQTATSQLTPLTPLSEPVYVEYVRKYILNGSSKCIEVNFLDIIEYNDSLARSIPDLYYELQDTLERTAKKFVLEQVDAIEAADGFENIQICFRNLLKVKEFRAIRPNDIGKLSSIVGTVTRTSEVKPELYEGAFSCNNCGTIIHNVRQQFCLTYPPKCPNATCPNRKDFTQDVELSKYKDWQKVKVQEPSDQVPEGCMPRTMDIIFRGEQVDCARAGDTLVITGMPIVIPDVSAYAPPGLKVKQKPGMHGSSGHMQGQGVQGLAKLGVRELHHKLAFLACNVQDLESWSAEVAARCSGASHVEIFATKAVPSINIRGNSTGTGQDKTPQQVFDALSPDQQMQVDPLIELGFGKLQDDGTRVGGNVQSLYNKMSASITPTVYGCDDVKKALLLMMLGGVHKQTSSGTRLRGDINICLVGDPSVAKSQLLKYVAGFMPRAVYTAGKSSSAAGLTASVVKDPDTGEFCIEAGALMLSDNGLCCIDEFDKMDIKDQVAIHEAMEQQTISIAKAGIQATVNARASILAAANPAGGRYDKTRLLRHNVSLPPAILSRFDLLHIMFDQADPDVDRQVAAHIISVARGQAPQSYNSNETGELFSKEQLQLYIKYARAFKPIMSEQAKQKYVQYYRRLRSDDSNPISQSSYRITVRQLEALVRLSEAFARLCLSQTVKPAHVTEAYRLLQRSIISVDAPDVELGAVGVDALDGEELDEESHAHLSQLNENLLRQRAGKAVGVSSVGGRGSDKENVEPEGQAGAGQKRGSQALVDDENKSTKRAKTGTGEQGTRQVDTEGQVEEEGTGVVGTQGKEAKQQITISAKKYNKIRSMMLTKLSSVRLEHKAKVGLDADKAQQTDDQQADDNAGHMQQKDLVNWYLEEMVMREEIRNEDQLNEEYRLVKQVLNHLIDIDRSVVASQRSSEPAQRGPEDPNDEEGAAEIPKPKLSARMLSLHPNFDMEELGRTSIVTGSQQLFT